ncbi:polyprenyl synthetase family protein [Mechercharimyces sp. CAU 1602]|uniref:polyprenyl synthetase family protein n=1 Tax=Mechercharimyces sp. CAU 1602 TaxID=2973933 RepID=UPI002163941C|nr:farnesyl diphosphate synthase [Mechercharimyces sp. CAU 1602]MCS1350788.1 polyprenyl synthetase family protein [Mechercharimyces sp. CAU 1602]
MNDFKLYLKEKEEVVHRALEESVAQWCDIPDSLKEAMAYSLLGGGKRLRPILVLLACEALGGEEKEALPFACVVEMIHTYSLIHDDLPAMDDDDVRRGRPTNHKVYGEWMAILAGDALLTKAFGQFASASRASSLAPEVALELIEKMSVSVGAEGMVAGQVRDIQSENKEITLSELETIHHRKTGDLISFSVCLGAQLAGANKSQLYALKEYAVRIGLAFQIQDDILDVIGDQEKIGKPVGSDEAKHKSTVTGLMGLEQARIWMERLAREAKTALQNEPSIKATPLLQLVDYLMQRDR